jgi:hypothetical protein
VHGMKRAANALAFLAVVLTILLAIFRCGSSPTQPETPPAVPLAESRGVQNDPAEASVASEDLPPDDVQECDLVNLKRAGVRHEVDGLTLSLFVPVDPVVGEAYVNVWTPDTHGTLLRRCPANAWCDVSLPEYGEWRIRLAAETKTDSGKIYQCDRHTLTVEARPPSTTTTTTAPTCDELDPPRVEFLQGCHGLVGWDRQAMAQIRVCNTEAVLTLEASRGKHHWVKDSAHAAAACESGCMNVALRWGPRGHKNTITWWVAANGKLLATLPQCAP